MLVRLVAASLFVTTTAFAGAPGETDPYDGPSANEGVGPGGVAPIEPGVVASPCGSAITNVMANRWAVGLSIGSVSVAQRNTGTDPAQFNVGQLSFRFRATPHLELELALGGGNEQLQDGTPGDREINMSALNLRYRFRPYAAWNWWLMGGLGGLSITQQGASDQERHDTERPFMDVGIGLERRWSRFALHAELSALSVGPMKDQGAPKQTMAGPLTTAAMGPNGGTVVPPTQPMTDNLAGGQFTIGASYYF